MLIPRVFNLENVSKTFIYHVYIPTFSSKRTNKRTNNNKKKNAPNFSINESRKIFIPIEPRKMNVFFFFFFFYPQLSGIFITIVDPVHLKIRNFLAHCSLQTPVRVLCEILRQKRKEPWSDDTYTKRGDFLHDRFSNNIVV